MARALGHPISPLFPVKGSFPDEGLGKVERASSSARVEDSPAAQPGERGGFKQPRTSHANTEPAA
jgi:hypothetical protein